MVGVAVNVVLVPAHIVVPGFELILTDAVIVALLNFIPLLFTTDDTKHGVAFEVITT